jgi:hypothetical protein
MKNHKSPVSLSTPALVQPLSSIDKAKKTTAVSQSSLPAYLLPGRLFCLFYLLNPASLKEINNPNIGRGI